MAWKLNQKAYQHARKLIEAGKITEDPWEAPTLEDFSSIEEYALYHLGKDPNGDPENAGTYSYPYGKNEKVYIRALRAIRASAAGARGATPNKEIYDVAGRLMEMLPEQSQKSTDIMQDNIILKIDKSKRIVTAPALVPYEEDNDGDVVSPEQIEAVAYKFMEDYQNIDIMHTFRKVAKPVESWILREPMTINGKKLHPGTWMLSAKIEDDDVWKGILQGKYTGYSVTAVPVSTKSVFFKKATLRELGWPWDVVTVSIVTKPTVPKARFISVKGDDESILYKIFKILEEKFRGDDMTKKEDFNQSQENQNQEFLNQLSESVQALKTEIEAIRTEIESIKTEIEGNPKETEETENRQAAEEENAQTQAIKGQIGTTKSYNDLNREIGVDRFGRPLKNT